MTARGATKSGSMRTAQLPERLERGGASWVVSGIGVVLAGLTLWYLIVFRAFAVGSPVQGMSAVLLGAIEVELPLATDA